MTAIFILNAVRWLTARLCNAVIEAGRTPPKVLIFLHLWGIVFAFAMMPTLWLAVWGGATMEAEHSADIAAMVESGGWDVIRELVLMTGDLLQVFGMFLVVADIGFVWNNRDAINPRFVSMVRRVRYGG
jgi:hypothetical protein